MIGGNQEAMEVVRWRGYKGPVAVIPQVGLDPAQFADPHSDEPDAADDSFRIGFAGRLVPEKGVLDLWEAFLPLANRAVLVLLGEGPLRDTILQQAATAGIAHRVEMPGYVPYAQMPAWLKSLDVLVLPSRTTTIWKEQFGHVLVEAMLAGVPVIGSNSGAIPEVIGKAGCCSRREMSLLCANGWFSWLSIRRSVGAWRIQGLSGRCSISPMQPSLRLHCECMSK